ncbi:MAG: hypothetical protein CMJ32_02890 [Phycisphaerae bacterium]|nr:hypothetical protein [Phycisphaerae bacterium]
MNEQEPRSHTDHQRRIEEGDRIWNQAENDPRLMSAIQARFQKEAFRKGATAMLVLAAICIPAAIWGGSVIAPCGLVGLLTIVAWFLAWILGTRSLFRADADPVDKAPGEDG